MDKRIAHIVVGLPIEGHFDYLVDRSLQKKICVGQRVRVPFHGSRRVGFVVGLSAKTKIKQLKPIFSLLDAEPSFSVSMIKLSQKFSEAYGCSLGEAMETALPTALRKGKTIDLSSPPNSRVKAKGKEARKVLIHSEQEERSWEILESHIDQTLLGDRSVIIIVPEVSLIEPVCVKLKDAFDVPVAILDKRMGSPKELNNWIRIKQQQAQVVVGTRSAIFAPVTDLGLIIVLDEANWSYKQEQSPFYHLREVAELRSQVDGCDMVFVSATPSVEIWHQAKKHQIEKLSLIDTEKGKVQIFDMSNYNPGRMSIISFPLRNTMERALKEHKKIVLLLNKRGFSTQTVCNQCGHTLKCPRCDVNLTYLYSKKKMVCRLCNASAELPSVCPQCRSSYIRFVGTGIEKMESEVARIFPQVNVDRFDKETAQAPRKADVIIATQAVLRVLKDIAPDVIAVLQFDSELNRMDFRSAHKAFALVNKLCCHAKEKVVLQTFNTDNYCVQSVLKRDFRLFYDQELKLRKELGLPPFQQLVAVGLRGADEDKVLGCANEFSTALVESSDGNIEISDPNPDILPKLRDKFRFTIMLKARSAKKILTLVKTILKKIKKRDIIITVNVNP